MSKEKEYESLRKEILEWQNRRFKIASGSLLAVAAIIGFILNKSDAFSWLIPSGFILWIISIAVALSYLLGLSATKISTYIEVFHESDSSEMCWERRQKRIKITSSRRVFFLLYLGVGVSGIVIPKIVCLKETSSLAQFNYEQQKDWIIFFIGSFCFVVSMLFLLFKSSPYDNFLKKWKEVKHEDAENTYEKIKNST